MGKRKRASNYALSQEEIWDDSALIRSWDEAVAEYEFYHSIAARGEDVEEVLRVAELEEGDRAITNGKKDTKTIADNGKLPRKGSAEVTEDGLEDGEVDEGAEVKSASSEVTRSEVSGSGGIQPQLPQSTFTTAGAEHPEEAEAKQNLASEEGTEVVGLGQDPILENIKMAYWWAGYYSGLYEGRKQVTGGSTR